MEISKQSLLEDYITKCDNEILKNDKNSMEELIDLLVSVYRTEIKDITSGLDSYNSFYQSDVDNLGDLKKLRAKLCNYLASLKIPTKQKGALVNITNQNNNTNTNTVQNDTAIEILFKNAFKKVSEMESLTDDETTIALEKLDELSIIAKSKDTRKNKWSKISGFLKWIADKSVDLAVAFSPVIFQTLQLI